MAGRATITDGAVRNGRVTGGAPRCPDIGSGRPSGQKAPAAPAASNWRRRGPADDPAALFAEMVRIRAFEEASAGLWRRGLISGEMHLGIGEEAVFAGVIAHMREGDGLAFDHRSGPPMVARGCDLEALVLEMLGDEHGLCRGRGGHMHFLAPDLLAAGTGIVGAPGPVACGFALAAGRLRSGAAAVAFFGDGAANQGMLLEALNLAVCWRLPAIFVCKQNGWAITTRTRRTTGGDLLERARGFGLPAERIDGSDVAAVSVAARRAFARARDGRGPSFLLARCRRVEGHFLGDPLYRVVDSPADEAQRLGPQFRRALLARPRAPAARARALASLASTIGLAAVERRLRRRDPLAVARRRLPRPTAEAVEREAAEEVADAVSSALARAGVARNG